MRPQEIDITVNESLVQFDETDEMFLAQNKEFYEDLTKLSFKEKVFNGEHGDS